MAKSSRIEQLIEDIFVFVDGCKTSPLSSNKVIVPKDEFYDLLEELKMKTPDEIKRCQKILSNREMIMKEAEFKAAGIIEEANKKAARLVSEHEILQQAYNQSNDLIRQANEEAQKISTQTKADADAIMEGAYTYTNDLLTMIENILTDSYNNTKASYDNMLNTLNASLKIVQDNKKELNSRSESDVSQELQEELEDNGSQVEEDSPMDDLPSFNDEDFSFDSEVFVDNIDQ